MADYMYLMARLPYLGIFPEHSHVSPDEILGLPEFERTVKTMKYSEYADFQEKIQNDIWHFRTEKEYFPKILPIHIAKHNPLAREVEVLKLKWNMLDMLCGDEPDDDWLWIYREKLNILKKLQKFDKKLGNEKYLAEVEEVRRNASKQNGAEKTER